MEPITREQAVSSAVADGDTPWPAGHVVHKVFVADEELVELLLPGGRRHWPMELEHRAKIGDLVVFEQQRPIEHGSGPSLAEPGLFQITHLWFHDGLAPDWAIASLRPVKLVTAE